MTETELGKLLVVLLLLMVGFGALAFRDPKRLVNSSAAKASRALTFQVVMTVGALVTLVAAGVVGATLAGAA